MHNFCWVFFYFLFVLFYLYVSGYHDVVSIPAGATSIQIHERHATNNYLALRNISKYYYLNGDWKMDLPGTFDIAGTVWEYSKEKGAEKLTSTGPTDEQVIIAVRSFERKKNKSCFGSEGA